MWLWQVQCFSLSVLSVRIMVRIMNSTELALAAYHALLQAIEKPLVRNLPSGKIVPDPWVT